MAALPEDVELYAEMHALIVQHGKRLCGSTPLCADCPSIDYVTSVSPPASLGGVESEP